MLTTPEVPIDRVGDGHLLALAVGGLVDADAYYRCLHDVGEVYVAVTAPEVRTSTNDRGMSAAGVVSQAVGALPIPITARSVANYLRGCGLQVIESESEVRATGGEAATFRFDEQGRLVEIRTQ